MAFNDEELEHIEQLIDNINMGTAKVQLGKIFIGLMNRVAELEAAGGGESTPVTWASIAGKPTTFPPVIGSTATTAKAGNYAPAWGDVTGKPSTFAPAIGTTAATAAAGNHDHAITADAGSGLAAAANLQALAVALSGRIKALEDAPA